MVSSPSIPLPPFEPPQDMLSPIEGERGDRWFCFGPPVGFACSQAASEPWAWGAGHPLSPFPFPPSRGKGAITGSASDRRWAFHAPWRPANHGRGEPVLDASLQSGLPGACSCATVSHCGLSSSAREGFTGFDNLPPSRSATTGKKRGLRFAAGCGGTREDGSVKTIASRGACPSTRLRMSGSTRLRMSGSTWCGTGR